MAGSRATGIPSSKWNGVLWARWNDALREAGLGPNRPPDRHPDAFMLEAVARLSRELGRLPTWSELRLKRRHDPAFPGATTLLRRFKSVRGLAGRLHAFCTTHPDHADIARHCAPADGDREDDPADDRAGHPTAGFVYLIKSGRYYKIGRSKHAGRRFQDLAAQLPERPAPIHMIRTDDPPGIERYWHQRFAPKRLNGEWFRLGADDVRAFRGRAFM